MEISNAIKLLTCFRPSRSSNCIQIKYVQDCFSRKIPNMLSKPNLFPELQITFLWALISGCACFVDFSCGDSVRVEHWQHRKQHSDTCQSKLLQN